MTRHQMRQNRQSAPLDTVADGVIVALWKQRLDTLAIAKHVKVTEAQVFNRLLHLRRAA